MRVLHNTCLLLLALHRVKGRSNGNIEQTKVRWELGGEEWLPKIAKDTMAYIRNKIWSDIQAVIKACE